MMALGRTVAVIFTFQSCVLNAAVSTALEESCEADSSTGLECSCRDPTCLLQHNIRIDAERGRFDGNDHTGKGHWANSLQQTVWHSGPAAVVGPLGTSVRPRYDLITIFFLIAVLTALIGSILLCWLDAGSMGASKAEQAESAKSSYGRFFSRRWVLAVLLLGGNSIMYICRANASDAVMKMYPGDKGKQSMVLTAYYCGYMCQFVYAPVIELYGAKQVLAYAVLSYGVFTVLLGLFDTSLVVAIALRALVGLTQGATFPCISSMASYWYPSDEWHTAWSLVTSGEALGPIIMFALGPLLDHYFAWQSIWLVSGGLALGWVWLFAVFGASKPESPDSGVCETELKHIVATRRARSLMENTADIPWKRLLMIRPFWATVVAHAAFNYGLYVTLGWLPSYFAHFNVNYQQMGLLTFLPYVMMLLVGILSGAIADFIVSQRIFDILAVRKAMNTIGFVGPAVCFHLLRFCKTSESLHQAAVLAAIGVGLSGCAFNGYWANFCDLSPRFAPHLLAISNSIAVLLGGVGGNILAGYLLAQQGGNNWDAVFFTVSLLYLLGAFVFLVFADAKPHF